jgi:hypothetical protein
MKQQIKLRDLTCNSIIQLQYGTILALQATAMTCLMATANGFECFSTYINGAPATIATTPSLANSSYWLVRS